VTLKDPKNLERLWKRVGLVLFILAIVLVAGPQIIDVFLPIANLRKAKRFVTTGLRIQSGQALGPICS
jgi:hypothetical protein